MRRRPQIAWPGAPVAILLTVGALALGGLARVLWGEDGLVAGARKSITDMLAAPAAADAAAAAAAADHAAATAAAAARATAAPAPAAAAGAPAAPSSTGVVAAASASPRTQPSALAAPFNHTVYALVRLTWRSDKDAVAAAVAAAAAAAPPGVGVAVGFSGGMWDKLSRRPSGAPAGASFALPRSTAAPALGGGVQLECSGGDVLVRAASNDEGAARALVDGVQAALARHHVKSFVVRAGGGGRRVVGCGCLALASLPPCACTCVRMCVCLCVLLIARARCRSTPCQAALLVLAAAAAPVAAAAAPSRPATAARTC